MGVPPLWGYSSHNDPPDKVPSSKKIMLASFFHSQFIKDNIVSLKEKVAKLCGHYTSKYMNTTTWLIHHYAGTAGGSIIFIIIIVVVVVVIIIIITIISGAPRAHHS